MRSTYVAAASLLSTLCHASPLQSPNHGLVEKRQAPGSFFAITGPTGGVQPRLEVRQLEKTGEMWNLYLLAMTDFEAMDQDDLVSYYQIAGIHGMPWTSWDGVTGSIEGKDAYERGYCPHANHIFGTWHRPYLALFEQQLQKIAKGIAAKFPAADRSKYQDAAEKLRLPFWDWAKATPASEPVIPTALTNERVQVTFPNGTAAQIDNPLYDYNFHPLNHTQINGTEGCPTRGSQAGAGGGSPKVCDEIEQTIRKSFTVPSNHVELDAAYRKILPSQRTTLLKILSQYQTFDAFSNDGACSIGSIGSLENIHNPIHANNWPGHMSPPSMSAFDPMFWLHHANVDRQMALFQAVFPNTYMGSCRANTETYTIELDEMLNADSPLTPFHKTADGDFWTSTNSRNIEDMGYTYPELVGNPSNETLVANIKSQYSGPANGTTPTKVRRQGTPTTPLKKTLYLAEVTLPLFALADDNGKGSIGYNILVFLGDVGTDPEKWLDEKSFVGMSSTLGGPRVHSDQITIASIDLSESLAKKIATGETTQDEAEEYLKENLKWRVGLGPNEFKREDVKGAKVSLISTEVEIAQSDDVFDRWVGGFKKYGEVDV